MLGNHAGGRVRDTRFVNRLHCSEGDGRKRNTLQRRWLSESSVNRWHGLAAFLTMMTVGRAPHRVAALHGLLGRGQAAAIGCVRRDRDGEHSHENLCSKTHPK
jgi:hypothetical protein